MNQLSLNPLQPGVACQRETSYLINSANRMASFYVT